MSKILVVDDDQGIRWIIKEYLGTMHGYEIFEAEDGFQAFNSYGSNNVFDLVITDCNMPGMSGTELIEKIRAISPLQRFVLMSGNEVKTDLVFIKKPFELSKLLLIVSRVLSS